MRLIDADAIKEKSYYSEDGYLVVDVPDIDDAPTIDAVPIVRCKDCKYGIDWDGRLGCKWHGFYQTEQNWFCADGERGGDETD